MFGMVTCFQSKITFSQYTFQKILPLYTASVMYVQERNSFMLSIDNTNDFRITAKALDNKKIHFLQHN